MNITWSDARCVAVAARFAISIAIAAGSTFGTAFAKDGDANGSDLLVWQANFGVSPSQSAELILDNTRCDGYAVGDVLINQDQNLGQRIPLDLAPGASLVLPVPVLSSRVGVRRLVAVRVRLDPGPCRAPGRFRASAAAVNANGTTDDIIMFLSPAPPAQDDAATPLSRLGPAQFLEYAVWNGCPVSIVAELETTNLLTGETDSSSVEVDPFQIRAVVPPIGDASQVRVVGFGTFSVRKLDASRNDLCPPGQGLVTITASLVNADGTTQASGLPTGKRRHHPVSLAKPIGEDED